MSTIFDPGFWAFVIVMAGIYTIFSLGLQVQYGLGGLLNFGHVASMAIAAYTMAILVIQVGVGFWWACLAGLVAAGVGGLLLGLTGVRLRGDYFAIVTIAFSEIIRYLAINTDSLTGGPQGTAAMTGASGNGYAETWQSLIAHFQRVLQPVLGSLATPTTATLIIVWAIALPLLAFIAYLARSPWGRALKGVREDEELSAAMGKNPFTLKLQALVLGAVLGGLGGLLYAVQFSFFSPDDFAPLTTFFAWIIVLLGGTARIWAVPVGALIFGFIFAGTRFFNFPPFSLLDSADRAYVRLIIIGLLLIGIIAFRPAGLLGRREEAGID